MPARRDPAHRTLPRPAGPRILLINPNITQAITDRLHEAALAVAGPGTTITALTARRGVPYIASRAEAAIGGVVALEMLAEHGHDADAAIIAAFGDPGLGAARELFAFPVIGMAEAAMLTACMLGRRFSIVSFSTTLGAWYRECVEQHGLSERLAGLRLLDGPFAHITTVGEEKATALVELAHRSVEEDGADVIVLAGAPLAGLAAIVRDRVPVPVVDGVQAALKQAEALAALRPRKAIAGSFRRPAAKQTKGLTAALAATIEHGE